MTNATNSPWDLPDPRGLTVVQGMLRVIVALQCWGAAAHRLQSESLSDLSQLLFRDLTASSPEGLQLDRALGVALLLVGLITVVRPIGALLVVVTAGFAAQAGAQFITNNGAWNWFTPTEQLIRIAAPLALMMVDWWPPRLKFVLGRFLTALVLLRLATVTSLAAQGLRALLYVPDRERSLELVRQATTSLGLRETVPEQAHMTLGLLGGIDVGMAIALLATRSKVVAAAVGLWSVFRISLWTLALGPAGYPETLLRVGLAGAPFVLAAFSLLAVQEFPSEIIPVAPPKK